jgi:hypothetical protein
MAPTIKMAVFWVVTPCGLVQVYQGFRYLCCLYSFTPLMMKAARSSEKVSYSLNFQCSVTCELLKPILMMSVHV